MKPLVSILIPAFNAENTIAETLESAVSQTWPRKEIIVVNDGSTDRTAEIVRQFKTVTLISTENSGFSVSENTLFSKSQGDYIQYLDADDILAADKIERQLAALQSRGNPRLLASSPWAFFYRRTRAAQFTQNALCRDHSPVEWLLAKMQEAIFMQPATWLVKRELVEKAGPFDTNLHYDQDGEFFCRVLLASEGTCFVPETGVYYRRSGTGGISYIGNSDRKKDSLALSLKLHIKYLLSLEDSERTRSTSVKYLQNWFHVFYMSRPDLTAELESVANALGGRLTPPKLSWKYAWIEKLLGWKTATSIQTSYNKFKSVALRACDSAVFRLERQTHTACN